jgi:hypothetical protein
VAILNRGRLLKTGTVQEMTRALSDAPLQFQLLGPAASIRKVFESHPTAKIREASAEAVEVELRPSGQPEVDSIIDGLRREGISVYRLARRDQTLEEVFMTLVGGAV